jgi:alkylation response protein AidB-like acyl-CoA dehydrogenase
MDLGWNEEQEMLRKTARDFLAKECSPTVIRAIEEDEKGFSPELYQKMADLGWMGLVFPEEYGGGGGNFLDLIALLEEMGRYLVPDTFVSTVIHCGLPILAAGTEEQKQTFLPQISEGKIIMTLALTEPSATYDPSGITVEAKPDKEDYVINGTKLFILNAHIADYLICVTRTKDTPDKKDGITLFLVDSKSPGISCTLLKTIASDRQCEVNFNNVRVPKKNLLGEIDQGWPILSKTLEQAAIAECTFMLGGAQQVLEMTVNYAKERIQFDRPIGSFQAIQHKCANMLIDIDGAKYITYQAAWRVSEGLESSREVSMAKAWVSEAYQRVCLEAHQIHGGIGFTKEHDLQLYFRRAKKSELVFGDANYHRELVAQHLGL